MSETPQSTSEPIILGSFAGLVGLLSIALYFTGWIYRWAYFGFFRLELIALDLPVQSFFFVPIQVFLGNIWVFLRAMLAITFTVFLIRATLWLVQQPINTQAISNSNSLKSRFAGFVQRFHRLWIIRKLRAVVQIFLPSLLRDLIVVAWILTILFWIARWQGLEDARQAAVNETSALPVITLVSSDKNLGLGRSPQDITLDPSLKKTRVIGDIGLFEKLQGLEVNDTTDPKKPVVWRLLINRAGWLYIFQALPQNANSSRRPLVLAVREGSGEQLMILSPTASELPKP
ncbi:hypothetical protein NUACC21_35760 [Scytonema sp. NUACC21]